MCTEPTHAEPLDLRSMHFLRCARGTFKAERCALAEHIYGTQSAMR